MVQHAAIFDWHRTTRTCALQVSVVCIFHQGHFLHKRWQLDGGKGQLGRGLLHRVEPSFICWWGQVSTNLSKEHRKENHIQKVSVGRNRVPSVDGARIQGQGDDGILLVSWKRLEETHSFWQLMDPFFPKGHLGSQFVEPQSRQIPAFGELRLVKVPDIRHIAGIFKVLLDRGELSHFKAIGAHPVSVLHRISKDRWGHQINPHLFEDLQSLDLGVSRAAMCQITNQGQMYCRTVPLIVLQEGKDVHKLTNGMGEQAISRIHEGRVWHTHPPCMRAHGSS
mmetsp:Transcript_23843/g.38879  ORF Transcript_23843/g.38879 Transcript_23843/m.38879 type:complete len:280 (-) Transcript_23843:297-1136(-)